MLQLSHCALPLLLLCSILLCFPKSTTSEICDICGGGPSTNVTAPEAVFTFDTVFGQESMNCTQGEIQAQTGFFDNCTSLHLRAGSICCALPEDETCPLCGLSGTSILPDPNRMVAGKTCTEWQADADKDFKGSDCLAWQKSFGAYCGCDISNAEEYFSGGGQEFCQLCTNKTLPYVNETFKWSNGNEEYCVVHEKNMNRLSYTNLDCPQEQEDFFNVCKCGGFEEPEIEKSDDSGAISSMKMGWQSWQSIFAICTTVGVLFLFDLTM